MIEGKSVTAVIVGRGGSRGLPGKNVADIAGRPMISWSVVAAQGSRFIDTVATSSDDRKILDAAADAGCKHLIERPAELASDEASVHDTVLHALDAIDGRDGLVVLLQATSPLRISDDIDACLQACVDAGAPAAVTVVPASKPPQWMFRIDESKTLLPLMTEALSNRRQDSELVYSLNGAVYVADISWYRKHQKFIDASTVGVVMPPERSIDVDMQFDLVIARTLIQQSMEK